MKGFLIIAVISVYICATSTAPPPPTAAPTVAPIDKEQLLKKATELDKKAQDEISKFTKLGRANLVAKIDILDSSIKELAEKIKITSGVLPLEVLESQLFWVEHELDTEIEAIEAAYNMVVKLLQNAQALAARIEAGITKVGKDTPVGKALAEEEVALAKVVKNLQEAQDARTIQLLQFDLALIEERVDHELKP